MAFEGVWGNVFTKIAGGLIGKGLQTAFPSKEGAGVQTAAIRAPSFNIHDMPIETPSKAGVAETEFGEFDFASANYEAFKNQWERRFTNYTQMEIVQTRV